MAMAGGIDLGGTKIEVKRFGPDWVEQDRRRVDTPPTYPELLQAVVSQVAWLRAVDPDLPVGIAAAGFANPQDGTWIAANLAANGQAFPADVAGVTGGRLSWVNDCRAFTQAEAVFGAGPTTGVTVGLVLGTGVAGGTVIDGQLLHHGQGQAGEYGHMPISAEVLSRHDLPVVQCGCGRMGCYETYGSGPGMQRIARQMLGRDLTPHEIVAQREDPDCARVWAAWCDVNAAMLYTIQSLVDPDMVILGGGLSQIPNLIGSLRKHLQAVAWSAFPLPDLRLSTRGETAAALGAAYVAWQEHADV